MKTKDIREKFLRFFEKNGHTRVPSSSLRLDGDPTLLFPNAGMNQFKECFLGSEKRDYVRAVTSQKCMRISGKHNDLESVGISATHHTFFEMLGNFSFGDYFKKEAIEFGWAFVTEELQFDPSRLWVTIFEKDNEAHDLWVNHTPVPPERVVRLGEKDNFWAMGDTGPCGPCTEIHVYRGEDPSKASAQGFLNDDGSFVEIWNLVFMEFNRDQAGKLTPLPKPSVDTGMGLDRVAAIKQGSWSNYNNDILRSIISRCEELSGIPYDGSSFARRDLRTDKGYAQDVAMRVIADHSRALAFLIGDGIHPSNDGRGYVLRRILRRAARHGRALEFDAPFLKETTGRVVDIYTESYPELASRKEIIQRVVDAEERKFYETLDSGLTVLHREREALGSSTVLPGAVAFLLHDTYGFPLDLTEDALKPYSITVDRDGFGKSMEAQKKRSREDREERGIAFVSREVGGAPTEFLGYDAAKADSSLVEVFFEVDTSKSASAGERASIVTGATPFYAESGGQVGDTGIITGKDFVFEVRDTQKTASGHYIHSGVVRSGELSKGQIGMSVDLSIDSKRRASIRLNHSATHLVHAALRKVLGTHVQQAGSRVDERSLRFDYSHFEAVSSDHLREISEIVNSEIRSNHEVRTEIMSVEDAKARGAMALFGEKYGKEVRVVEIGPRSLELCGGTHVQRSGDIGFLLIDSESGISAGVRRIECTTGDIAESQIEQVFKMQRELSALLKSEPSEVTHRIEKQLERIKQLERERNELQARVAQNASGDLVERARTTPSGVKVVVEQIPDTDTDALRSLVDRLKVSLGSGIVALASSHGGTGILVAGVTSDLTSKFHAGNLVKEAASAGGGRGGGRADFAQAGGVDPAMLEQSLQKMYELIG